MKTITFDRLTIYDDKNEGSVIKFAKDHDERFTIIYGPSDTGKTLTLKCIGVALGSDWDDLLPDEYVRIQMEMTVGEDQITVYRERGHKCLNLSVNDSTFEQVSISKGSAELNERLSSILDFRFDKKLIKNSRNERATFTWLSLLDLFTFISGIDEEQSVLLVKQSPIPTLTKLNYLFNGNSFDEYVEQKEFERAASVHDYIDSRIKSLQNEILNLDIGGTGVDVSDIEALVSKEEQLLAEIQAINEQLAGVRDTIRSRENDAKKLKMDVDKYRILKRQYDSKAQRLNFIADAIANDGSSLHTCPICHNHIDSGLDVPDLSSVIVEYRANAGRADELNEMLEVLERQYSDIISVCNELKDSEMKLESDLEQCRSNYAEVSKTIKSIGVNTDSRAKSIRLSLELDSLKLQIADYPKTKYNAFGSKCIDSDFKDSVVKELHASLNYCFGYSEVELDTQWNPVIDGKDKSTHGSGYCGIINSLTLLAIAIVLKRKGSSPGFIIIDSPLTAFSENKDESGISSRFLEYVRRYSREIQIIIADNNENIADELDTRYKDNSVIFTKSDHGRYGLLNGYPKDRQ